MLLCVSIEMNNFCVEKKQKPCCNRQLNNNVIIFLSNLLMRYSNVMKWPTSEICTHHLELCVLLFSATSAAVCGRWPLWIVAREKNSHRSTHTSSSKQFISLFIHLFWLFIWLLPARTARDSQKNANFTHTLSSSKHTSRSSGSNSL